MGKAKLVLSLVLLTTIALYSQTAVLKTNNAVQYFFDPGDPEVVLTEETIQINNHQYFKRKHFKPWVITFQEFFTYERIEGDSLYFILNDQQADSLIFNFKWQIEHVVTEDTTGNSVYLQVIDEIKFEDSLVPNDTLFVIKNLGINLTTGDTTFILPNYSTYSKKLGWMNEGLFKAIEGAKINGVRYGTLYPYPDEVYFTADSVFIPTIMDTGYTYIVNSSTYPVRIDTLSEIADRFYGYRVLFRDSFDDFQIYLTGIYPRDFSDTLRININPHDSIEVLIFDVDLCPICDNYEQRYFKDTLKFHYTFLDDSLIDIGYRFKDSVQVSGMAVVSDVESEAEIIKEFNLDQNYPNPFNPATQISYTIPTGSKVTIVVYNLLGNEVEKLVDEYNPAGTYNVEFNAKDLPSGVYFYKLTAGNYTETRKMILIR